MRRFYFVELIFVLLFFIEFTQFCLCKNTSYRCFERERQALLNIKKSFDEPSHRLSSWEGTNCCKWQGVSCSKSTGHVVKLDLHTKIEFQRIRTNTTRLVAREMNPSLLELKFLNYLDLSGNNFQGSTIPKFLGLMKQLEYLNLTDAYFTGIVPRQLGDLTNLRVLDLHENEGGEQLSIKDFKWVSRLKSLQYLDMSSADLSGARNLMQVLNMLPFLLELRLSKCMLNNGHLPRAFVNSTFFSAIQHLDLSHNLFSEGPLPSVLQNMTHLDLSHNLFSEGPLPSVLQNMTSLRVLDLSTNSFNSSISLWLGNLKNLVHLNLAENKFNAIEGGLTMMLWNHCHLKSLDLFANTLEKESLDITRYSSGCTRYDLEELGLSTTGLTGHLPDWLCQFKRLKLLNVSGNSLKGPIPATIGRLSDLRRLILSGNELNGVIPATIGNLSALRELWLSYNNLNGVIPATIGNLFALKGLNISYNQLNGVIPATIGNLSALRELRLSSNNLNGVIPATIGNLFALKGLDLSSNNLNEFIQESLGQILILENLDLTSNSLEGALSEIHFSNLSKLVDFKISFNHLSFKVKREWVPPFQLSYFDMNSCKFQTQFPQWLETQKKVGWLDLSNASISGPLPNWLWFMHINTLDLSHNHITGPLPRNIGDTMPTLRSLKLAGNLIKGTIPSSFFKIHSLEELDLSNNMVSGDIPNYWSDSNQLFVLKISSNKLTGVFPNSIGRFSGLKWLHLNNNSLHGELPLSLRNCTRLKLLNLGESKFSGNIPTWIGENLLSLQILRLRKNMLDGYFPPQLCQLTSLQILDLANNSLSGTIPHCFENFSGMVLQQTTNQYNPGDFAIAVDAQWDEESVEVVMKGREYEYTKVLRLLVNVDLSDNNLIGTIPEGLAVLNGLNGLNLSHNYLTGSILKNIGNLRSLESLDFSENQLSGNIPESMSDLTWLSYLNLSYNNFSGKIPTSPQLQTLSDPSIYAGNLELCGALLLKRCPGNEPPQAPTPNRDEENDKSEEVWFYTIPVLGYITGLWGVVRVLLFKKSWRYAYFQLADNVIDWIYVKVAIKSAWLKKKMAKNHNAE